MVIARCVRTDNKSANGLTQIVRHASDGKCFITEARNVCASCRLAAQLVIQGDRQLATTTETANRATKIHMCVGFCVKWCSWLGSQQRILN